MDPITREEMYLAAAAGYAVEPPEPITRKEVFLAKLAGMDVETPAPFTRRERFIEEAAMAENNAVIEPLQVTENGTYTAPAGVDGYNPVTVDVPAPEIVLQDKTITENGEYTADDGFDGLGKVTVDVAGSGGGSLPAGLYWSFGEYQVPNNYYQNWFVYKGVLYTLTRTATNNGNEANLYKLLDGAWSTVFSDTSISGMGSPAGWTFIEFDGLMHMIGRDSNLHYVFNGTTFSQMSSIPQSISNRGAFLQNNKLKAYSYYDGNVYVWNKDTNTWVSEATVGSQFEYKYFISDGVNVYYIYSNNLYKYENGASSLIGVASGSAYGVLYNSYFYNVKNQKVVETGKWQDAWYKFDFASGVNTLIGYGQNKSSISAPVVFNNNILSISVGVGAVGNVAVMYEVTE